MPDYSLCAYCYAPDIDGEMDHYDDCPTMTTPTDKERADEPIWDGPAAVGKADPLVRAIGELSSAVERADAAEARVKVLETLVREAFIEGIEISVNPAMAAHINFTRAWHGSDACRRLEASRTGRAAGGEG